MSRPKPKPARKAASAGPAAAVPAPRKTRRTFDDPEKASIAGQKGAGGRPRGAKSVVSEAKLKFLAVTGQTPLDFLSAVYRDQLYSEYDVEVVDEKRGLSRCYPKTHPVSGALDCAKLKVSMDQRIQAATAALPYVHQKLPSVVGVAGTPDDVRALFAFIADSLPV